MPRKNQLRLYLLLTFAGEKIDIEGIKQSDKNSVSVQGTFILNNLIRVSNYHTHYFIFRDSASYVGLFLVAFYWFCCFLNKTIYRTKLGLKKIT